LHVWQPNQLVQLSVIDGKTHYQQQQQQQLQTQGQ